MGYVAGVYVRALRATPRGEQVDREVKAFLQLLATYCDERRRGQVYGTVQQWAEDHGRRNRRIFDYLKEAVSLGLLTKEQEKRGSEPTFYFTKYYSSASAAGDSQTEGANEDLSAAGDSGECSPLQSNEFSVQPVTVASAARDSQIGTNDARVPIGIPIITTNKITDSLGGKKSREPKELSSDQQKVIDYWKVHIGVGTVSLKATGVLKELLKEYGLDRVESALEEMAGRGIASHQYLTTIIKNQVLRESINGRRPEVQRRSRTVTAPARGNSRASAESIKSALQHDEESRRKQAEWERRDRARRAAAAKPGTLDLFGADPDARGSS